MIAASMINRQHRETCRRRLSYRLWLRHVARTQLLLLLVELRLELRAHAHQSRHAWFPRRATVSAKNMHLISTLRLVSSRDDLAGQGIGVLIHLPTDAPCCGQLEVLELHDAGVNFVLPPSDGGVRADDAELARRLALLMMRLRPGAGNAHLAAALARHAYDGTNTLNTLSPKVLLEVDELIICPPNGVVLVGWLLAATGTVCAIRVRSGRRCVPIDPSAMIRLERADVLETVGVAHGLPELRNGFIAYVPDCLQPDQPAYLEVETSRGTVAHRPLPTARMRGLTAMRFLLDRREYRYHEVAQAYDGVLGPAIAALNADRLQERADISEISFGAQPATPVLSVIVPLYGRIDFMEYQFAFLSRHTPPSRSN